MNPTLSNTLDYGDIQGGISVILRQWNILGKFGTYHADEK